MPERARVRTILPLDQRSAERGRLPDLCGPIAERQHLRRRWARVQGLGLLHHRLRQGRQEGPELQVVHGERQRLRSGGAKSGDAKPGDRRRASRSRLESKPAAQPAAAPAPKPSKPASEERAIQPPQIRAELAARRPFARRARAVEPCSSARAIRRSATGRRTSRWRSRSRCKRKPRDLAQRCIADDRPRARGRDAAPRSPARASSTSGSIRRAARRELRDVIAADEQYGRSARVGGERVVTSSSCRPIRPARCTSATAARRRSATRSATLLECDRAGRSRASSTTTTPARRSRTSRSACRRASRELARRDVAIPEGGYHGDYIREIAAALRRRASGDATATTSTRSAAFAVRELRKEQDLDLQAFGVQVRHLLPRVVALHRRHGRRDGRARSIAAGTTYEKDGALWLRTTRLRRRQGPRDAQVATATYTYFVPDVAYHVTKWERGFTRAINVQGADHHSTVTRVRAGLQALDIGIPHGYPDYVLHQMVTVMQRRRGGEDLQARRQLRHGARPDRRSRPRRGALLLPHAEGRLAARLRRRPRALAVARRIPVYYIQMAHARMCGIFRVGEIDPAVGHRRRRRPRRCSRGPRSRS